MKDLKIGLQLYSVYADMQSDLRGTLRRVKEMGYDGVELVGLCGHTSQEIKAACEEAELLPISAHVSLNELKENPAEAVANYAMIGCRHIVFPWVDPPFLPDGEKYAEFLSLAETVAGEATKYGITVGYHNHTDEIRSREGGCLFDRLMTDTSPAVLRAEPDTLWVLCAGEEPLAFLRRYRGRVPLVHFKDYNGKEGDAFEFRPLGSGVQDIADLIAVTAEIGAEAIIVEQDRPTPGMTAMECAEQSVKTLRALIEN